MLSFRDWLVARHLRRTSSFEDLALHVSADPKSRRVPDTLEAWSAYLLGSDDAPFLNVAWEYYERAKERATTDRTSIKRRGG